VDIGNNAADGTWLAETRCDPGFAVCGLDVKAQPYNRSVDAQTAGSRGQDNTAVGGP
jgi:hypothetical protein